MSNWSATQLTDKGRALDAKVTAGTASLNFTKMKLGSGTETVADIPAMTDLSAPELVLGISSCAVSQSDDTICELIAIASSENVQTSFIVRELGVFATDPDDGEILYAVMLDSNPDTMPNHNVASPVTVTYQVNIMSANAESITAVIDPAGLVSVSTLSAAINAHDSSAASHADLLNLRKPSTEYVVGDIAYSALLPSWSYLECTVAGTTDSGDLPVPSSVSEFSTFTDGTVTWKIQRVTGKLPLSGGTMLGKIATNQRISMTQTTNDDSILIVGGASYLTGAHVALFGNNRSDVGADRKGSFALGAVDTSQNLIELIGKSNKSLTWDGVEVKQLSFPSDTQINIHDYFTWSNPVTTPYDLWKAENYTVPSNGYFVVMAHVTAGAQWGAVFIYSSNGIRQSDTTFEANVNIAATIPVRKGQVIGCDLTNTDSNTMLFIPCVGEVM